MKLSELVVSSQLFFRFYYTLIFPNNQPTLLFLYSTKRAQGGREHKISLYKL